MQCECGSEHLILTGGGCHATCVDCHSYWLVEANDDGDLVLVPFPEPNPGDPPMMF